MALKATTMYSSGHSAMIYESILEMSHKKCTNKNSVFPIINSAPITSLLNDSGSMNAPSLFSI